LISVMLGNKSRLYEFHEFAGCIGMTYLEKSLYGHGGIPQPTKTVIPIAYFSHSFGQACR
ncbi:hypothetical protein L0P44_16065, partial [Streptococcus gordonii]|nr:hypothetical protein [Streptococcus gordonii]